MAVDLFQRIIIKNVGMGVNLSEGPVIGSGDDALIHLLEQQSINGTQEARALPQTPFAPVPYGVLTDSGTWFLTTALEFAFVTKYITDVDGTMGAEQSAQLQFLHDSSLLSFSGVQYPASQGSITRVRV